MAGELITLSEAKAWLGITDSSQDAKLTLLVASASDMIAAALGRDLTYATLVDEWRDGTGSDRMVLLRRPVVSVSSVTIDDIVVPEAATVLGSGFRHDDIAVYLTAYHFTRGRRNVLIQYGGGFQSIPANIKHAALISVQALNDAQSVDLNMGSEAVPGVYSAGYGGGGGRSAPGALPTAALLILEASGLKSFVSGGWP